ncbi:hypothetical protein D3C86_1359570 [compost metagenome]
MLCLAHIIRLPENTLTVIDIQATIIFISFGIIGRAVYTITSLREDIELYGSTYIIIDVKIIPDTLQTQTTVLFHRISRQYETGFLFGIDREYPERKH